MLASNLQKLTANKALIFVKRGGAAGKFTALFGAFEICERPYYIYAILAGIARLPHPPAFSPYIIQEPS
jgi:hypothetical protein